MLRWIHYTLFLAILPAAIMWIIGFFTFVGSIPKVPTNPDIPVKAAVVLTGGSLRLQEGLDLLENGKIDKLFISGVGEGVSPIALLGEYRYHTLFDKCCGPESPIALGYAATNTYGNAVETKRWLEQNNYRSIRLITSHYHMPRSLLLFRKTLGTDITIIPHPVFPESIDMKLWWESSKTRTLLIREYNKYIGSYIYYDLLSLTGF